MIWQVMIAGAGAIGPFLITLKMGHNRVHGWELAGILLTFYLFIFQVYLAILTKITFDWNQNKIGLLVIVAIFAIFGPIISYMAGQKNNKIDNTNPTPDTSIQSKSHTVKSYSIGIEIKKETLQE